MPSVRAHRQFGGLAAAALAASLALHTAGGAILAGAYKLPTRNEANNRPVVELEVVIPPASPPPVASALPAPAVPPTPIPIPRRLSRPKAVVPLPAAPPPSTTAPEPEAPPADPVTGVTSESVVDGPVAVAVPVGNTLGAGGPPTNLKPTVAPPYAGGVTGGSGTTAFSPVAEGFVKQWPRTLSEVRAAYPDEAQRLQVNGTVRFRVGIDETGKVREVKVIKRAGYGLDEAATQAMWRFKFAPAIGQDGRPVAFRIHYDYTFTPGG